MCPWKKNPLLTHSALAALVKLAAIPQTVKFQLRRACVFVHHTTFSLPFWFFGGFLFVLGGFLLVFLFLNF